MPVAYPHRIRLRGPWECVPLSRNGPGELPSPRRVTMPVRWGDAGLAGFAGRVRFVRRFGYPGSIDETERVWLTFAGVEATAEVTLNGQSLGVVSGEGEFEVTALLRPRNELVVDVEAASDRGGLWGEAAMEVRRTAYLKDVRVSVNGGRLEVSGRVVGSAERPLELYAILDRSNIAYGVVRAGQPFALIAEDVISGSHILRVELVDGAVIWYAIEVHP